jgi:DNA topoisomerase-1
MRSRHVRIRGPRLRFEFVGKGAKRHDVELSDPSLARIVRHCQDLPGQVLFQYLDDAGKARKLDSTAVNLYLREHAGDDYTAKDFRTWTATVAVARAFDDDARERPSMGEALAEAARLLGNTPAICRKSYVHPDVLAAFTDPAAAAELQAAFATKRVRRGLDAAESAVLRYLARRNGAESDTPPRRKRPTTPR